jgi:hypothetical protein
VGLSWDGGAQLRGEAHCLHEHGGEAALQSKFIYFGGGGSS